jgi:predicted DNA-binding WGR domain protein
MKVSRKPSTTAVSAPPPAAASSARRLEFIGDGSAKFWEASTSAKAMTVRWGKIGTAGQHQTKEFATPAVALAEMHKLVAEKTKKGYVDAAGAAVDGIATGAVDAALAHAGGAVVAPTTGGASPLNLRAGGALEGEHTVVGATLSEDVDVRSLTAAQQGVVAKFVKLATAELPDNEEGGDNVCQIGSPTPRVSVLIDRGGDVLGVAVRFTQSGGALPDDGDDLSSYYETKAEAVAAGVDVDADVSWSLSETMMFDASGKALRGADGAYWEWTGW